MGRCGRGLEWAVTVLRLWLDFNLFKDGTPFTTHNLEPWRVPVEGRAGGEGGSLRLARFLAWPPSVDDGWNMPFVHCVLRVLKLLLLLRVGVVVRAGHTPWHGVARVEVDLAGGLAAQVRRNGTGPAVKVEARFRRGVSRVQMRSALLHLKALVGRVLRHLKGFVSTGADSHVLRLADGP